MPASVTTLFARILIPAATTWSKEAGLVIVGFCGHRTTTALGRSLSGSTSSIFKVWPLRLPAASGVVGWLGDYGDTVTS